MNMTTKQRHEYRVEALMQHTDGALTEVVSAVWEEKPEALASVVRMKNKAQSEGNKITKTMIKKRTVTITEEESDWETIDWKWEDE